MRANDKRVRRLNEMRKILYLAPLLFLLTPVAHGAELFNSLSHTGTAVRNSILNGSAALTFDLGHPSVSSTINQTDGVFMFGSPILYSGSVGSDGNPAWCIREYNDSGYSSYSRNMFCISGGYNGSSYVSPLFTGGVASHTLDLFFSDFTHGDFNASKYYLMYYAPEGSAINTITVDGDNAGTMVNDTSQFGGGGLYQGGQASFCLGTSSSTDCGASVSSCDDVINMNMIRPSDGSTITNDFSSWTVSSSPLLEGCSYKLVVGYLPNIGSIVGGSDSVTFGVTPDNLPTSVNVPKSKNIWNFYNATTTQVDVSAQIINAADGVGLGFVTSTFYIAYSASSSPLTAPAGFNPTLPCGGVCTNFGTLGSGLTIGSIGTATGTIALAGSHCTPASDWTDIGGGIAYGFCSTINFLFVPNDTTQGILAGDMNALQGVPPFSWFFATNNAILNGTQDTAHLTPNLGITYEITGSSVIPTSSLNILPADLASMNVAGGKWFEFMNVWFNFLITAIIILCVIMLYKVAL